MHRHQNLSAATQHEVVDSKRRQLMLSSCGILLLGAGVSKSVRAQAAPIPITTLVNRSGRLRALSQRTAKAYTQMALGILPDKAFEILVSSQALIERSIQDLRSVSQTTYPDAAKFLTALSTQAKALITLLAKTPTKEEAAAVSAQADLMLIEAEKTTHYFQTMAKSAQAKIVNISGRQRMLSQRAAKSYFLIQAGHDTKAIAAQLQLARSEFQTGLEAMTSAPISTVMIRQDLELAKQQWAAFEISLDQKGNATMSRNIATTSERLLELMDNLTNQYDQALKEMLGGMELGNPAGRPA